MKVGDEIDVKIKAYGVFGEGIAEHEGSVIFVPFAMKDELCKISISEMKKKFAFGRVISVQETSKQRVVPPCPFYFNCGGCDLLHMSYKESLNLKLSTLAFTMTKMLQRPLTFLPIEESKNVVGYRNKAVFQCRQKEGKWIVGMFEEESNTICDIDMCLLQNENINIALSLFRQFLDNNPNSFENNRLKFFVVRALKDQVLLTIVCENEKVKNFEELAKIFSNTFKKVGIWLNINTSKSSLILSDNFKHIYGLKTISISSMGIKQEIGPYSFLQINEQVKDKIYKEILNQIGENSTVIDAYGGAGQLSALCAKKCEFVYSIEINKEASDSANELCKINDIQNQININGDCSVVFPKLVKNIETNKLIVILDPPRKGSALPVLESILKMAPHKIIYLSCNPATLARDVEYLTRTGLYGISAIKPFDMFPCTHHIETLFTMTRQ